MQDGFRQLSCGSCGEAYYSQSSLEKVRTWFSCHQCGGEIVEGAALSPPARETDSIEMPMARVKSPFRPLAESS